ncbi:MAG: hypothetical protein ACRDKB_06865 [Actinomycetota bacterium]
MSEHGAYEDEMRRFFGLSDRDIDRLLDGRAPASDGEFDELASFLSETKAALAQTPPTDVEEAHVAAIVETARISIEGDPSVSPASKANGPDRVSAAPPRRRSIMSNRFVSLIAKAAATAVAAMILVAGLAFAGVDLPGDAAEEAFDAVLGVELPNQGDDLDTDVLPDDPEVTVLGDGPDPDHASPVALAVFDLISNWAGEFDCEFGIAVATTATEAAGEEFTTETDPCAAGDDGQATGETKAAEGKATGDSKSAEGRTTGDSKSAEGQDAGDSKSGEGQDAGSSGQTTGEEKSGQGQQAGDDGQETGEEQAEQGQSNRP